MTITRRSRFQACLTYEPGHAELEECDTMTAKQFANRWYGLRKQNPNASVFVTIFRNGQQFPSGNAENIRHLASGNFDEIEFYS